jgi:NADPH-dependent curcumin reductase CurA
MIIVLALLLTVHSIASSDQQNDQPIHREKGFLFDNFPGYKLSLPDDMKNLQQKTTQVPDRMDCVFACVGVPWCRSVNFKATPQENRLHLCELISTQKHPKNLTKDESFTHLSTKVNESLLVKALTDLIETQIIF